MAKVKDPSAPVEKILVISRMLNTQVQSLLENITAEDFIKNAEELRKRIEAEEAAKSQINKPSKEILKILSEYNEAFARQVLLQVKGKIAELKALGVLEKFKNETTAEELEAVSPELQTSDLQN